MALWYVEQCAKDCPGSGALLVASPLVVACGQLVADAEYSEQRLDAADVRVEISELWTLQAL